MNKLLHNIRFYVLMASFAWSIFLYAWVHVTIPPGSLQTIRLVELYALTALTLLYLALLIGPLVYTAPQLPWRGPIYRARRAIGVSTFYFGNLHAYFAFFGLLGGWHGVAFLNNTYLVAISLSATALVILGAMALTSFDRAVQLLTFRRWKMLHRLVYLAAIFVLIHALLLGSQFSDLSGAIPQISFGLIAILLFLEARRFDAYLRSRFPAAPAFGVSTTLLLAALGTYTLLFFFPAASSSLSLNIHAQHLQLARQAQQQTIPTQLSATFPGLQGDPTRRFTMSFAAPSSVQPNQATDLTFRVFDANSGNAVSLFTPVYTKLVHLVIVDDQLQYFSHIHPIQTADGFSITTQFPKPGIYHLYLDFQPLGAIEQQFAFTLPVGTVSNITLPTTAPDTQLTKTFDNYAVTLSLPTPLSAAKLSLGEQQVSFTIRDAKTQQPITSLQPYLGAFGHLVLVNEQTFAYIHVHPAALTVPKDTDRSGPTVSFLPLGLYGPIKPGIYRAFAQFNPDGHLFTADFTISVAP